MQDTQTVMHSDDEYAPVAYLKCGTWRVEPKPPATAAASAVVHIVTDEEAAAAVAAAPKHTSPDEPIHVDGDEAHFPHAMVFLQARTARDVTTASVLGNLSVADEARLVLESMHIELLQRGLGWKHVTMMGVYLTDMADFAAVNDVYSDFLPIR